MEREKYLYVFKIHKRPKVVEAYSMQEAITKIEKRYWVTMPLQTSYLLMTNDPEGENYPYEINFKSTGILSGGYKLSPVTP